jgi:hypothetical protein
MSRSPWRRDRTPPWLLITSDSRHNVALVKSGPKPERDLFALLSALTEVNDSPPPQRSAAGGYLISLPLVADLQALAQHRGEYVVVRERRAS